MHAPDSGLATLNCQHPQVNTILGWDIGGVNIKAALVVSGTLGEVLTRPFELQHAPERLARLLADMAGELTSESVVHAVTMTAELSQMFRTKREGVRFVLAALHRAFPDAPVQVYTTAGAFVSPGTARERPLDVAAANWVATATLVARHHRDVLLIDVGTTTADLIPIVAHRVAARGRTDTERLVSGELVYTGAVRTPVEAVVRQVPVPGGVARVSAEGFALTGDVYVWLGDLGIDDYDAATPDGRPAAREFAGERLARIVCADREMLDDEAITRIANAVAGAQLRQLSDAIRHLRAEHPGLDAAVVTGLGAFIGERAARAEGLPAVPLTNRLGVPGARSAPAAAVALLLHESLQGMTVVKVGGSLLADSDTWRDALATIASLSASRRLIVVPGGGPFADRVRWIDAIAGLSDDAAHWMAIAAMDQHAEMIAATDGFSRVFDHAGILAAHDRGQVPVIAPLQWLRSVDPLPHSWEVTSDSISAWLAGRLGAGRLVLIKSAGASGPTLVDDYFPRALPPHIRWDACSPSELEGVLTAPEHAPR